MHNLARPKGLHQRQHFRHVKLITPSVDSFALQTAIYMAVPHLEEHVQAYLLARSQIVGFIAAPTHAESTQAKFLRLIGDEFGKLKENHDRLLLAMMRRSNSRMGIRDKSRLLVFSDWWHEFSRRFWGLD